MNLQFYIEDRHYTSWYVNEQNTLERKQENINPFEEKIFSGDVCRYENEKIVHLHSCIRSISHIRSHWYAVVEHKCDNCEIFLLFLVIIRIN